MNNKRSLKKSLLLVDNSYILLKDGRYYAQKHAASFYKELLTRDIDITLFQFHAEYDMDHSILDTCISDLSSLKIVTLQWNESSAFLKIITYLRSIPRVFTLVSSNRWCYFFYPGHLSSLSSMVSILIGKPFGLYIRGEKQQGTLLNKLIISNARFALTVSPLLKQKTDKFCKSVNVIFPMVDLSLEDVVTDRIILQKPKTHLIYVGRCEPRKGIYDLLETANILTKCGISYHLDIVGGGPDLKAVKEKAELFNLPVTVWGLISERNKLKELYQQADIFIFPSHDEGFPRVLYEAMASGLPILTTFVGGIGHLMRNGYNCIEIPVLDPQTAAVCVQRMITDVELRKHISANATNDIINFLGSGKKSHAVALTEALINIENHK